MMNQDFLDALAFVSFVVGVANYNENLTQNDKDDLMKSLDEQTKQILTRVEAAIEEQNSMLEEIRSGVAEILKRGEHADLI